MKNTGKKIMVSIWILSLTAGFIPSEAVDASTAKLNKTHLTLIQGEKYTLKARGMSGGVTWTSSRKKIATVSRKGKVTAKKTGKAKIIAKTKKRKLICKITVKRRKTVVAQTPDTTQKPVVTQTPGATQIPVATQKPIATQIPVATQKPITTQIPVATQKPVATQIPVATQKPVATQIPVATQTPSSTPVTEESAYNTLNSLRSTYPEGMPLTNSYYYYSPQFGNGYGCYGFAAKLSDTVFGTTTPYKTHSSFNDIKTGDHIRIGNSHSVIVLSKSDDAVTVVEGNYNSSVHWDRKITFASLTSSGFKVYTRY